MAACHHCTDIEWSTTTARTFRGVVHILPYGCGKLHSVKRVSLCYLEGCIVTSYIIEERLRRPRIAAAAKPQAGIKVGTAQIQ